uniref:Uncharacterized protein n=1 Tax=Strongyloides venezuelensis TaxID=75913 RepID=A0A0K0F346_STRVS
MVKLVISLLLLLNFFNSSYSTEDVTKDTISDELLFESNDNTTKEIVQMISSTVKLNDLSLELGNNENYVKNKPFVIEKIRQNIRMIDLLADQINDVLLPLIKEDFGDSKIEKEKMDNKVLNKVPGQRGIFPFLPLPFLWKPQRPTEEEPPRSPIIFQPYFP